MDVIIYEIDQNLQAVSAKLLVLYIINMCKNLSANVALKNNLTTKEIEGIIDKIEMETA